MWKQLIKTLFLLPTIAFAWWDGGHMVIAEIAYSQLSPSVKEKVDVLVEEFAVHYPKYDSFAAMAVWADDNPLIGGSHAAYLPFDPDKVMSEKDKRWLTECFAWQSAENGVWKARRTLENRSAPTIDKCLMLAYLVHLVGDLHQPLHTASRFSKKHPFGDHGGNDFLVKDCPWLNLHALWDAAAGAFPTGRYAEKAFSVHGVAETLMRLHPVHHYDEAFNHSPNAWSREGQEIVETQVYLLSENTRPTDNYLHHVQQICQKRAAIAGYRLGYLLNEIFE